MLDARWIAGAALLDYTRADFVGAHLWEAGPPELWHLHGGSTRCYAARHDDFVPVASRG